MLQEDLGTEYEITSIFKFNAPLANVSEDVGKLGNDHKGDHITIVGKGKVIPLQAWCDPEGG